MRESTNADRKRLKIAFSIANCRFHPAGDVTKVSVMPRKVIGKIGMPRIGDEDAEIKIDEKKAKISVRLVLSRVPFNLESEIRPIKCENMSSLY